MSIPSPLNNSATTITLVNGSTVVGSQGLTYTAYLTAPSLSLISSSTTVPTTIDTSTNICNFVYNAGVLNTSVVYFGPIANGTYSVIVGNNNGTVATFTGFLSLQNSSPYTATSGGTTATFAMSQIQNSQMSIAQIIYRPNTFVFPGGTTTGPTGPGGYYFWFQGNTGYQINSVKITQLC